MTALATRNPDFVATVRESFARQQVMSTLGASLTHIAPGEVDIQMPIRDDFTQQNGFLHAGILATVADSACGYAAYTLMPAGSDVLSVKFKLNLLAPAVGESVIARARVLRAGRTITVCRADVHARGKTGEKLIATMLGTMMNTEKQKSATA